MNTDAVFEELLVEVFSNDVHNTFQFWNLTYFQVKRVKDFWCVWSELF